jgi:hypothetical protein
MNIDRPNSDFQRGTQPAPERGVFGRGWDGIKRWSGENPRLSRVVWFALAIAVIVLVVFIFYPPKNTGRRGMINNGAQPVGVAKAVSGDINVTLNALGTVTPLATATVRPQVSGMLIKLNFTEGQLVKAGDVLARSIRVRSRRHWISRAASWRAMPPTWPTPRSILCATKRCRRRAPAMASRSIPRPRW